MKVQNLIVGGGIVGVALAYYLTEHGVDDVLLVESATLAAGCTGGSFGGVRQQFSTPTEVELGIRGRRFWSTFEETFGHPCAFNTDGYLLVTGRAEVYEQLAKAAQVQVDAGAPQVEMLDAAAVERLVPWLRTDDLLGGCWTSDDGHTNPTDGVYGLASIARSRGVRIREHFPVRAIEESGTGWQVVGPETVQADRVIVAAGLATPALMAPFGLKPDIRPLWVHYALTTPVLVGEHLPLTLDLDTGFILQREQDGALVSIIRSETDETTTFDDVMLEFGELAAHRAPLFADVGVRSRLTAAADQVGGDGHPYVGRVRDGLYVAAGFDGHGTMQGPAVAELLAGYLCGRTDPVIDISVFDPWRTPTESAEWLRAARR